MSFYFSHLLITIFYIIFGFAVPILVTEFKLSIPIIMLLIVAVFVVSKIIMILTSKRIRLLEITFYGFTYIFLIVSPLAQISHQYFPLSGWMYDEHQIIYGIFTIGIGLLGYEFGLLISKKTTNLVFNDRPRIRLKFIITLAFICMTYAIHKFGGIFNLLGNRNEIGSMNTLILINLLRTPIFVAWIFTIVEFKKRRVNGLKITNKLKLSIVILLILNFIGSNPFYTSRYWYGSVLISTIIVLINWNKNTIIYLIYALLSVFLIIFPYADVARDTDQFRLGLDPMIQNLIRGDFDVFQMIMNVPIYIRYEGLSFGEQLLGVIFFFIPRSLWPNKPIGTGATIGSYFNYLNTNISAPLWAEFQINFGLIGVFFGFVLYGVITNKLQIGFNNTRGQMNFYQVFVPFFAAYQIFILRGDLMSSFAGLSMVILFMFIGFKDLFRFHH